MSLFWAATLGLIVAVMPPTSPPVIPTPSRVFDDAVATESDLLFCVPSFLESWARDPVRRPFLKRFRSIIFAGGPLQPAIGDELTASGINLAHAYGMTETGGVNVFLPNKAPEDGWNYFHFSPHADPVFIPVEGLPLVHRLIVKKCATHHPAVLNTFVDGVPALDTNDLLVRHPTNEKLWKVYGRQDDQIMHSTGEKTNPAPLEAIILKDARIKHAIMFGRGHILISMRCAKLTRFVAGVLVFQADATVMDSDAVADFRRQLWPTVQKANDHAPSHSRIFKEMILLRDPSKPVPLTAKGTPIRAKTLQLYEAEIESIYAASEQSAQTHLNVPRIFDLSSSTEFVRLVVGGVVKIVPADDEDLFQRGCDRQVPILLTRTPLTYLTSLQATWIRNSPLHGLATLKAVDINVISHEFVYSHPTIRRLAEYITALASGSSSAPDQSCSTSDMEAMAMKYTQDFPQPVAAAAHASLTGEAILVTGTTGALGSHILAHLLSLPEVSVVYALNRAGTNLEVRQRGAFEMYGLDVELLRSAKLCLLEGNPADTTDFGLTLDTFNELKERVTCIIHNAWQVDFNLTLSSLEPCIAGTRNLVDFALTSPHTVPPRLLLVSSFGVFRNWPDSSNAPEESILDPKVAVGSGYAESKWVAEQVLEAAARCRSDFEPIVVRLGQLSGAANGAWKRSEWFPTLLKLSQDMGRLPSVSGHISWVPVNAAGKVIAEMRRSQGRHLHLTNPHPTPFSEMITWVAGAMQVPVVSYAEWLDTLEALSKNGRSIPLLPFFLSNVKSSSSEAEAFLGARVSNEKAMGFMKCVKPLEGRDAAQWVAYLRGV
ncbi:male sterility protein-domain-containing protein [Roridomyces roridus]|uniref:Male sterility protein-domain-containing protein n=1 Tax=Roridomyces roridus TaxID=1738132 RepID=A0AAD7FHE6_9AGAR|nr:male sterility protein-domain-containing protein [Roridomyces roridus]